MSEQKNDAGVYSRHYIVSPDYCDKKGGLSPEAVFIIFQAISAEHAQILGIGAAAMKQKGKFWVIVHNRIDFEPGAWLLSDLTARTWALPCGAEDMKVYRSYTLENNGKIIAKARNRWAILGLDGKAVPFGESGFPEDYAFPDERTIEEEDVWFEDDFTEDDLSEIYTARSTDVDFAGHVNNVVYVRMLLDQFPADQITGASVRSIEIHYGTPVLEKEQLKIYKKQEGKTARLAMKKADGRTAVMASVTFA